MLTPSAETVSRSNDAGANAHAEPRPAEHGEQREHRDRSERHHEHAVAGDKEVLVAQRIRQPSGHGEGQGLRAPDDARAVLEHESQAEGQQQAVERIASVDPADQQALDEKAEKRGQQRRHDQRAPEAEIGHQRIGEIGADRQEAAMGEIDHAGQVEDERQAERHQRIERADDETVEHVEEDELRSSDVARAPARRNCCSGDP